MRSTSLNSLFFTRAHVAQGPCRLWQAAWLFLWALFPLSLHALPNLAGVQIEQAPILGQPLDVRIAIAGTTEWRLPARAEEGATNFTGATWRRLESAVDSSRRYAWSSDALVEDPVLRLVLVNAADPSDRQILTLLPELPLAGLSVPAADGGGLSVSGSVAAGAPASLSDRSVMPRLELLQPQAGEQLRDSERMRLLQLETEALLLRESLAAFEDEQARLRVRIQEAEAIALASEQRLREAVEEVERLRDMLYARDAALESLRDKIWMTLIIGLIVLLLVILGFVLWWRSELPDRKLREEARARMQWRSEHEPSPQPVEPMPASVPPVTEVAPEPVSTPESTPELSPEPTPTPEPIPSAPVAGVDPFMLDMVRAHLDLGDVAAADATLQLLEQTAADDAQVVALRAQIQQQRSDSEAGH